MSTQASHHLGSFGVATEESAGFDSPRQLVGTILPLGVVPTFIDMRQTRWPWWENAIRVNPLHWRNAIMDDLKFTSFCPPAIADLEGESFEDSAAQLSKGSSFHAAPSFAFHHDHSDTAEGQRDHA